MKFNDIYKDIIKSSRLAYFYAEIIRDKKGKIIDALVLDANNSFAKRVELTEEYITNNSLARVLYKTNINWLQVIRSCMSNGNLTTIKYIENINYLCEAKFTKIDDNSFYMTLTDIPRDNITNEYEGIELPSILWHREKDGTYVTEEHIQNDLLLRQNIQFDEILNAINDTIILLNNKNIIYVNDAFEEMFGVTNFELFENPNILYELFDDEHKNRFGNYAYDKIYDIEIKIKTREGQEKWVRYKDYHIEDDKVYNKEKITIISDITEKKEMEIEIERLRAEFFSNITHELKTPLNLIFSSLQLLELKSKQNINNDKDDKYIRIIRQNSLRLLKLVNNIIDSTKIDSQYLGLVYENEDIVYFVEQVFNSIEEYSTTKNIELIFDTDMEEKVIAFDMDKMERIILNLLSNAIKFNKDNGKIYLNIHKSKGYVDINIKDTGIGIPKEKISNVFDRFIQVNNRMTKISEGSGIGLSLTKSLVEMHGGTIEVESNLGYGTEFKVRIPDKLVDERVDEKVNKNINAEYNSFVKKFEIEFSDIY